MIPRLPTPLTGLLVAVLPALAFTGCGLQMPTPDTMGVGYQESFRVSYVVRCRECRVFYTEGRERAEVQVEGSWSRTVRIRDADTRFVQLTASPTAAPGYIQHAYIEVDGRKVAEERRNGTSAGNDDVTLSAGLTKG